MKRVCLIVALMLILPSFALAQIVGGGGNGNTGTITGVTPGTGMTGGGTAGNVTLGLSTPVLGSNGGSGCASPLLFANLPVSPSVGDTCTITDSNSGCTTGTPVTAGSGVTPCTVTWLGANWLPAGGAAVGGFNTAGTGLTGSGNTVSLTVPSLLGYGGTNATTAQGAATNIVDGNTINPKIVNSIAYATQFSGADIGAKVNAAMTALSSGGTIMLPAGASSFSTTIQCPTTSPAPMYIIRGHGTGAGLDGGGGSYQSPGTVLKYTGSGDAINQVVTNTAYQNMQGCQFRDFTLDGSGAGGSAIGINFGGVSLAQIDHVDIQNFGGKAIQIDCPSGAIWTERFGIHADLWKDTTGLSIHTETGSTGCLITYGNIYLGIQGGGSGFSAISLDGTPTATLYQNNITIFGNMNGTSTTSGQPALFTLGSSKYLQYNLLNLQAECDGTDPIYCARFANSGAVDYNTIVKEYLTTSNLVTNRWNDSGTAPVHKMGDWDFYGDFTWSAPAFFASDHMQLPCYVVADLGTVSGPSEGTVVCAADGTIGSHPCSGSSSGALAFYTGTEWDCK